MARRLVISPFKVVQSAGIIWMLAGAAFLLWFLKDLAREHQLRTEGFLVEAVVLSETKTQRSSDQYRGRSGELSRNTTRLENDHFELKYKFEVPGRGEFKGLYGSSKSLNRPSGSTIEILYLPENPESHALKREIEISTRYKVSRSVRFIVTFLFFAVPGWMLIKLGRKNPQRAHAVHRSQQGGISSIKKNRPKGTLLRLKLVALVVTTLILLMTFLLPPYDGRLSGAAAVRGLPAPLANFPIGALFYIGLFSLLIGLGLGHAPHNSISSNNPNSDKVRLRRYILAVSLMIVCAWLGMFLHQAQGDTTRARSMIIFAMIGLGSLLLNRNKLEDGPKDGTNVT